MSFDNSPAPAPVPVPRNNGLAVASMVLGIVGIMISWFTWGLPSLLAVIFGHLSLSKIKQTQEAGKGMAIAGLATGYVGLLGALFWILVFAAALAGSTTVS